MSSALPAEPVLRFFFFRSEGVVLTCCSAEGSELAGGAMSVAVAVGAEALLWGSWVELVGTAADSGSSLLALAWAFRFFSFLERPFGVAAEALEAGSLSTAAAAGLALMMIGTGAKGLGAAAMLLACFWGGAAASAETWMQSKGVWLTQG